MFPLCTILILIAVASVIQAGEHFRTVGSQFQIKTEDQWIDFESFAGINMGVSPPGKLPGEVALRKDDYIARFERLERIGARVIRVYALQHSDFYETLVEWNKNQNHTLYVLHGTAFPEYEFEENNGADSYNNAITNLMKSFIYRTVKGVYGGGDVIYRYEKGDHPVYARYTTNIAEYLLGWVIGGEITPFAINRTNEEHPEITTYNGKHISAEGGSSPFECWMAEMMDFLASESTFFGETAPISHTNWVTTDGIKNPIEPRFPNSTEDWMEIDQTRFQTTNWTAGVFYNLHAYPYYPYLVSQQIDNEDPFKTYIQRIRVKYADRPLIITETGLSTSVGVASHDTYAGRDHGHVGSYDQGVLLANMMNMIINELGFDGVVLFQLQDEWFKKTWNTRNTDTYNRHLWKNVLSAEQNFGLFEVSSSKQMNSVRKSGNNDINSFELSHDTEFVHLHVTTQRDVGQIVVGIDNLPQGSRRAKNLYINTVFKNMIDSILIIDLDNEQVEFKILGTHSMFLRNYGVWLRDDDGFPLDTSIDKVIDPENGLFYDYNLLVRVPGYWNHPNGSVIKYGHQIYTLKFERRDKLEHNFNLALLNVTKHNNQTTYHISIPFYALGYTDPSTHSVQMLSKHGNLYQVYETVWKQPIRMEIMYLLGDITPSGVVSTQLNWDKWYISFCEKPKEGINFVRQKMNEINKVQTEIISPDDLTRCIELDNNDDIGFSLWYWLVTVCFFFLWGCFIMSSVLKWIYAQILYCSSNRFDSGIVSNRLRATSLLFAIGCTLVWYFDVRPTKVEVTPMSIFFVVLTMWDSFVLLICMLVTKWSIYKNDKDNTVESDTNSHAFIVMCHNSSDVIQATLESIITRVEPRNIYVADNGSSNEEMIKTERICNDVTRKYHVERTGVIDLHNTINYGYLSIGNKTIAQYATLCNLHSTVKYVTCVDDDTLLHDTWSLEKVLRYFEDREVAVIAYPLKAHEPQFEIEYFQNIEYLTAGFMKIFHSQIRTTLFNSGAFGTYRVDVMKRALLQHNTRFHGDDLQICLKIHNLRDHITSIANETDKILSYKVKTATNMIASTIVPKCWIHSGSISEIFANAPCSCQNPDLFRQRVKGWFLSEHQFLWAYIKTVFNLRGFTLRSLWVRLIILYDSLLVINQYIAILYTALIVRYFAMWVIEAIVVGLAINVFTLFIFDTFFLRKNRLEMPIEVLTMQPIIYKFFIVTIYKYLALLYNAFVYVWTKPPTMTIEERQHADHTFNQKIGGMYLTHTMGPTTYNTNYTPSDVISFASGSGYMGVKPLRQNPNDGSSYRYDSVSRVRQGYDNPVVIPSDRTVINLHEAVRNLDRYGPDEGSSV